MEGTVVDMFVQGLDAFITSIIVSFMVVMLSQQQTMASMVSENQNTAAQMQEYREYNAFEHKHVYAADVISLIMKKKGYPEIEVRVGNKTYTYSLSRKSTEYNTDTLYQIIDPRYLYDADVAYEDATYRTGVNKVTFKACTNGASCGY